MKSIRKKSQVLSFFMAITMLLFSCSQYEQSDFLKNNNTKNYSGEEIFKGIFFFQGEIPQKITLLKDEYIKLNSHKKNEQINQTLNDFATETIAFIKTIDKNYFDNFSKVMKSGNNFKIQETLVFAAKLIDLAGKSSKQYSSYFLLSEKIINDEILMNKIKNIDLNTEKGQEEIVKLLDFKQANNSNVRACTPGAVFCVYYLAAVAVSYAVAAYTVIAAANVIVKLAAWVWAVEDVSKSNINTENMVFEISNLFSQKSS
jgi:hypothetical protein